MFRTTLLLALSLAACGLEPTVPAVQEAPLVAQLPAVPPPILRGEQLNAGAPVRLRPELASVQVHSLAAADGTHVKYLVGMMGCGISVVTRGTATVHGGAFTIPSDPSQGFEGMSLFLQFGERCDPESSQVFEVPVASSIDLSTLPEESFVGCWLFDSGD